VPNIYMKILGQHKNGWFFTRTPNIWSVTVMKKNSSSRKCTNFWFPDKEKESSGKHKVFHKNCFSFLKMVWWILSVYLRKSFKRTYSRVWRMSFFANISGSVLQRTNYNADSALLKTKVRAPILPLNGTIN